MAHINEAPRPVGNTVALWQGQRPRMADAAVAFSKAVYQETTLSYREAEAARHRIALINGCLTCQRFRVVDSLKGLLQSSNSAETPNLSGDRGPPPPPELYDEVENWRTSALFSDRERLAIEFAERIAVAPIELPYDDAFWRRMHALFDDGEIVDLTYSITSWIAGGRFGHVLGLDGACEIGAQKQSAA